MFLRPIKAPPRRPLSRLIGLRPWTVGPMDDDLLRPWRAWYGISLFDRQPRRPGDRSRFVRTARCWFRCRGFVFSKLVGSASCIRILKARS